MRRQESIQAMVLIHGKSQFSSCNAKRMLPGYIEVSQNSGLSKLYSLSNPLGLHNITPYSQQAYYILSYFQSQGKAQEATDLLWCTRESTTLVHMQLDFSIVLLLQQETMSFCASHQCSRFHDIPFIVHVCNPATSVATGHSTRRSLCMKCRAQHQVQTHAGAT